MCSQGPDRNRRTLRATGLSAMCVLALTLQLEGAECSELSWQIRRLKREIGSLQVLSRLRLSAAQKAQLVPIVKKAVAAEAAQEQSLADLAPEMLEAYTDFKAQAQRNLGSSQDVTERAEDCHRLEKELRNQLKEDLIKLESEVRSILTPDQLTFVDGYSPRGGGRSGGRSPRGGRGNGGRQGPQGQRTGPLSKWTSISHFILCPAALGFLDPQAEGHETMPLDEPEALAMTGRIRDLESDIRLLNLINGLNLTSDQMRQLVTLAQDADDGEAATFRKSLKAEKEALQQAKEGLLTHGQISHTTRGLLRRTATGRRTAPRGGPGRMGMTDPALARWVDKAETLLTEAQREVLAHFKPCLVPPESQRDPVRAGQAEVSSRFGGFIEHMRRAPEGRVQSIVEQFATGEEQKMGSRTPEARQARINELLTVIRKARAMSDTEFAINKDQLAAEVQPAYSRNKRAGGDPTRSAIENYLLDERIIPLLKERLKGDK